MRTPEEMLELILNVARADDNIRSVLMVGSRADKSRPADRYQDFDVSYFVRDIAPYWDNMDWIERKFGRPSLVQRPESMELVPPCNDGSYMYLMIFPDGNRIDLQINPDPYVDDGEPAVLLLDKDGDFAAINVNEGFWYVKRPEEKIFSDCCNEFHWCLNNVAKGIARDELTYSMGVLNGKSIRGMLNMMLEWYIGAEHDFQVSSGKMGKNFKRLLPGDMYRALERTYTDYEHIWDAAFGMLELFGRAARLTAGKLGYGYDEEEEKGIRDYMEQVRTGRLEY